MGQEYKLSVSIFCKYTKKRFIEQYEGEYPGVKLEKFTPWLGAGGKSPT